MFYPDPKGEREAETNIERAPWLRTWGHVPFGRLPGGLRVKGAAWGSDFLCALLSDGQVYCAGENEHGQLGDGTTADRYGEYMAVAGLNRVTEVRCTKMRACCALRDNGTVACWGGYGVGSAAYGPRPQEVAGMGKLVALSPLPDSRRFAALTEEGGVYEWGQVVDGRAVPPAPLRVMDPE